jgi:hypothetical protein
MKKHVALAVFLGALATPALAQPAAIVAPGPAMAPLSGPQFRQIAMMSDMFEIESSRLALQRARQPAVQRFAREMVQDHQATSAALNGGTVVASGTLGGAASGAIVGGIVGGPVGAAVGAGVGATAGATADATGSTVRYAPIAMIDARHADMLNQLASAPPPAIWPYAGLGAPGSGRAIHDLCPVRRGSKPSRFCTIGIADAAASPWNGPAPAPLSGGRPCSTMQGIDCRSELDSLTGPGKRLRVDGLLDPPESRTDLSGRLSLGCCATPNGVCEVRPAGPQIRH